MVARVMSAGVVGELALTGEVRSVPGVLPMTILAQKLGFQRVFLPDENAAEASVVKGIEVLPVRVFDQIVHHLAGNTAIEPAPPLPPLEPESYLLEEPFAHGTPHPG